MLAVSKDERWNHLSSFITSFVSHELLVLRYKQSLRSMWTHDMCSLRLYWVKMRNIVNIVVHRIIAADLLN